VLLVTAALPKVIGPDVILTLHISKVQSGLYDAHVLAEGVEVTTPKTHSSIEEAIRAEAAAVPEDFARFMEVRYAGVSSGTLSCAELTRTAAAVADKLVGLAAEIRLLSDQ
jgi:hypothetical protein